MDENIDYHQVLKDHIDRKVEERVEISKKMAKALDVAIFNGEMLKTLVEEMKKVAEALNTLVSADKKRKESYIS